MFTAEFWTGIIGVVVGGVLTLIAQYLKHRWDTAVATARDKARKHLLKDMLDHMPTGTTWRKKSTMANVIGCSEDETARLLIEIGARGSETDADLWAYVKKKPLR